MGQDIPAALVEAGHGYEALFVPSLFAMWTRHLLEGSGVRQGSSVLDVACGTGVLARGALAKAGRSARIVGVDPAPGMLAVAAEREPAIEWVLCGAEQLELDDNSFDCIVSQFGMMFFEDRVKAAEEMFRVLKPGGSLAIAVWRSVEYNVAYADVIDVLDRAVGKAAADALRLPFSLGDADEVVHALSTAGFQQIAVTAQTETANFPSSRQMVEAELRGWLPMFDIHLEEAAIHKVLIESDRTLAKFTTATGEAVFPTSANIFTASKE